MNGRRVSIPVFLKDRDRITFGKTEVDYFSDYPTTPIGILRAPQERDTQTSTIHERRLITVMVADMRNFTGLAQQMEETALSVLIGNWFRQAGYILREGGSWVDKYIGDAVMALWFHQEERVTSEEILKILRTIHRLQDMTQRFNHNYPLSFPLQIGVGLNTGHAMVGNTGSGDHPDYTAIGDTVNAAFRLESITKQAKFDIALSAKTFESLETLPELLLEFQAEEHHLKGYDEPMIAYGISFEKLAAFFQ